MLFEEFNRPNVKQKDWMTNKEIELILGTKDNLSQAIDECINAPTGVYGLDLETTGLDSRVFDGRTVDSIVGIGISPTANKAYYFPVAHQDYEGNIGWSDLGREFSRLFDLSVSSAPVLHNASFDLEFLEFNGYKSLGAERWDSHDSWHDTQTLAYLLDARAKGKRGLKYLSSSRLNMEMIELDELIDGDVKDYSTLDPSWEPCIWYAGADPLCTLRLYESLKSDYDSRPEHTSFMYGLEKMTQTAVRWMHRCRVRIDAKQALKLAKQGQGEWFDSLKEVYQGASEILGRDVEPLFFKLLTGSFVNEEEVHLRDFRFDPSLVEPRGANYKVKLEEARLEASRQIKRDVNINAKYSPNLNKVAKRVPNVANPEIDEEVIFPQHYDVMSAQQIGLMFREMKVPGLVAGKSGNITTNKAVLNKVIEEAEDSFPFMSKIKRFRETAKALTQYLIPMIEDVAHDGSLKPRFDQYAADTGRFSCKTTSEPWKRKDGGCRVPFQGIPATYDKNKPECVNSLRSCVVPEEGDWWMAAIDYAGVELRLITNLSNEPKWITEFFRCSDCNQTYTRELDSEGFPTPTPSICTNCGSDRIGDLHSLTAIAFYGEASRDSKNWKQLRQNAKGCNFALCYGGTGRAVVRTINCTEAEGDDKYNRFIKTYKTLYGWWNHQHQYARKNEFVKTAFGRVLDMPDINDKNRSIRGKDERKSVNSPIQGTSADITKLAMSLIYKGVKKRGWMDKLKMVLTVHDEIVFEIHESIMKEAIEFLCKTMVRNSGIKRQGWVVPLLVDVEIGKNWKVPYDLKDLRKGYTVNRQGEKVYDELPASLVEIFKEESADLDQDLAPEVKTEPKDSSELYKVSDLTEEEAVNLSKWVIKMKADQKKYKVVYDDRDITMLLN